MFLNVSRMKHKKSQYGPAGQNGGRAGGVFGGVFALETFVNQK